MRERRVDPIADRIADRITMQMMHEEIMREYDQRHAGLHTRETCVIVRLVTGVWALSPSGPDPAWGARGRRFR